MVYTSFISIVLATGGAERPSSFSSPGLPAAPKKVSVGLYYIAVPLATVV